MPEYLYSFPRVIFQGISPGIVRSEIMVVSGRLTTEQARQHYDTNPCLEPVDIAEAVKYALATPPHVQVCSKEYTLYSMVVPFQDGYKLV
jgi:NADP-dependent 3-hydroxy acid dehydrogenase YdfG